MRLHMHAADVRHLVTRYFLDLGLEAVDVGVLQFYDADGEMLQTVNLFTELQPQRAAA